MTEMNKVGLFLMLILVGSNFVFSKLSKAMRTFHETSEVTETEMTSEEVTKSYHVLKDLLDTEKQSTISYKKLRNILLSDARNVDNICSRNERHIFKSDLMYKSRRKFWVNSIQMNI